MGLVLEWDGEKAWENFNKQGAMKKESNASHDPDMLDTYDFSSGVRGKYAQRYAAGSNIVRLDPDVAEIFPDSDSVNEALRTLIKIARQTTK
jgi:hypothetical protein